MIDLPDAKLPQDAVLWWHYASEETLPSVAVRPGNLEAVRNHLRAGGTALFSLIAASYVVPLEIEAAPPDTVSMDAFFASEAELSGLQSRRGHTLLSPSWGVLFTSANSSFPPRPAVAYTADRWPATGHVWAVHKTEHATQTPPKVGIEYPSTFFGSGGSVLTLGAHFYFSDGDNQNRPQLEHLATDALRYLGTRASSNASEPGSAVPFRNTDAEPSSDAFYGAYNAPVFELSLIHI